MEGIVTKMWFELKFETQDKVFSGRQLLESMSTLKFTTLFIFSAFLPLVSGVTVSTNYGKIEGLTTSYPNASGQFKSISKFLGVPFAAPPVEELRFKAPRPPKEWKLNVRPAKKHGNICLQGKTYEHLVKPFASNFSYSEDCLYLDIYTPDIRSSLPVLIHIHGGSYMFGTAITFPSDILALQGVVVVVIQYRLGPFGFLTTGDSSAPGNYGMLDQVEALKWVKNNIENFGGNPSKVTIFGLSTGGSSVSLHLLSPLSKGLFHQAIAESGVDLSPFAIQPSSAGVSHAKDLAKNLDCPTSDHSAMIACMRGKEATDILKVSYLKNFRYYSYLPWAPVVDKKFLYDSPQNLREKKDFTHLPLMVSFNSHEGATTLGYMVNASFGLMQSVNQGVSPELFKDFVTKFSQAQNSRKETANLIADSLEFMYTPWPDNSDKYALRSQLVDLLGDWLYFAPSHEVADIQSQVAQVYVYEFAHKSKKASLYSTADWMGVVHADNKPYGFGIPLLPQFSSIYDTADRNVSLFIMAMYANFARSGDPSVSSLTWETYNSSHRAYLRVDANPRMAASFYPRRMALWNDYYPKLEHMKFETKKEVISHASKVVTMGTILKVVLVIILVVI